MIVFVGDQSIGKLALVWPPTKTIISFLRSKTSPRDGRVVPSRQDRIKLDRQLLTKRFSGRAFGLIQFFNDVNRRTQARLRGRFSHQSNHRVQAIKQYTFASPGYLRKETSLNRVVLRTVGRIVSDTNIDTQFIGQFLQVLLEDMMTAVVAAPSVAKPQHGSRIRVPQVTALQWAAVCGSTIKKNAPPNLVR